MTTVAYRDSTAVTLSLGKMGIVTAQLESVVEEAKQYADAALQKARQMPEPVRSIGSAGRIAYENDVRATVEALDASTNVVTALQTLGVKVNTLAFMVTTAQKIGGITASAAARNVLVTETTSVLVDVIAKIADESKGVVDLVGSVSEMAAIAESAAIRARWAIGRETVVALRKAYRLAESAQRHCANAGIDARSAKRAA